MLTLKLLREQPDFVIERLAVKNFDAKEIVAKILEADAARRAAQTNLDSVLAEQNAKAKEIGMLMKQGKKDEAEQAKKLVASLKEKSPSSTMPRPTAPGWPCSGGFRRGGSGYCWAPPSNWAWESTCSASSLPFTIWMCPGGLRT